MRHHPCTYLLALTACATADAGAGRPTPASADACVALVAAPPESWAERIPLVLALGAAAVPDLIAALRQNPDAAGAQAAVATLGQLGNPAARAWLEEQVEGHGSLAAEAALALGRLSAPDSIPTLIEVARDRLADPTLRAACAAALNELGAGAEVLPLIRALVLAGSPAGAEIAAEVGLPTKPRWAMERYLVLRALRRVAPEVDFGLDTDSPWPDLERSAATITSFLESR